VGRVSPHPEEAELRAYLGAAYEHERLLRYDAQVPLELERLGGDEDRLYRESEAYLYDLTAFAMTGTKDPYRAWVAEALPPGAHVLDVGCGIGSDGLALLSAGFRVTFADFDNPSTRYLRWRLERRGLDARVVDLDREPLPAGADLAYAFDVLEHVDDPFALLGAMERAAGLVLVNLLESETFQPPMHRDLPIADIVSRARARGLRRYERLHAGRSHLLLYCGAT
jgi:SAM-dependent methyltransferase